MSNVNGTTCFKSRKAMFSFLADAGYALDKKYGVWTRADGHEVIAGHTAACGHHVTVERF